MQKLEVPTPRTRWVGIIYFIIIHVFGIIGVPIYHVIAGFTAMEWGLFFFYFVMGGMAITVGYHRLFAHGTFHANAFLRFVLLFFGAGTFEQSALKWASQHRQHHRYTDTDFDPYNIKKGFFYAHIGWIIFWKHKVNHANVGDLVKDPLVLHQHRNYGVWSVVNGMLIPMVFGVMAGRPLAAFLLLICLRLTLVMNAAFFINSFAHTFGSREYDDTISARDHWTGAFLTNGEGYHNFHHKFPHDYRNGVKWYHWDPSKWFIYFFSLIGWTWGLQRIPDSVIAAARHKVK